MSRIDDLFAASIPNGVKYQTLGDLGTIFGGLTGKSKADFSGGNARFVSYVNVFSNLAVDIEAPDYVRIAPGEKQRVLQSGDILFTGSSETSNEVGMSSVVTAQVDEPLYLNSFCIGFRFNDPNLMDPSFAKHLFRSAEVRTQILRTANGVTRFNVSKVRLAQVKVPIPPVDVQREIVRILDSFGALEAELKLELSARQLQYAHYRDLLLTFDADIQKKPLGHLATVVRGASPRPIQSFLTDEEDGVPWIKIGDVAASGKYITRTGERVTEEGAAKSRRVQPGDFLLSNSMSFGRPYISKIEGCIHDGWLAIRDFSSSFVPDFLYYLLRSNTVQIEFSRRAGGGAVRNLNADIVRAVELPVPSLHEQKRIADILDKFDLLVNDSPVGIPAELRARYKQYEYYRDRLLTFKEMAT